MNYKKCLMGLTLIASLNAVGEVEDLYHVLRRIRAIEIELSRPLNLEDELCYFRRFVLYDEQKDLRKIANTIKERLGVDY